MIRNFDDKETEQVWRGERSRKLPSDIQQTARRKLRQINRVAQPADLRVPRGNRFEELKGDRKGTYSVRINHQWLSPSGGVMEARSMSGSRTTTNEGGRLENVHPGDILREDFLIGREIAVEEVAEGTGLDNDRLTTILAGTAAIDADTDLRLSRYFGISEGFFLGLQNDYDLEEVRRAHGAELDRIVRRAA